MRAPDGLDLSHSLERQANTRKDDANKAVDVRINSTWIWALVPHQDDPAGAVELDQIKVTGSDALGRRTAAKLVLDELLLPRLGGIRLRMVLDKHLWSGRDHVTVGELSEWFPRYVYLPRIRQRKTLTDAIADGASTTTPSDTFATAEQYDEDSGRYLGLRVGQAPSSLVNSVLVVKTEVARAQQAKDAEEERRRSSSGSTTVTTPPVDGGGNKPGGGGTTPGGTGTGTPPGGGTPQPPESQDPKRFIASVQLDGLRMGRDAGKIAEEVLAHLVGLDGASASIALEINVRVPGGISEDVVRTVSENAAVLGFSHASFEKE